MNRSRWIAVVTSELQLLSLLEAQAQGLVDSGGAEVLCAGRYRPGHDLVRVAARRNISVGVASRGSVLTMSSRRQVAVGDFFGQATLARLAQGRLEGVLVLEDGLSTLAAIMRSPDDDVIVRPRLSRGPLGTRIADGPAARSLRRLSTRNGLHWIVNEAGASIVGQHHGPHAGQVHTHTFSVLRSLTAPTLGIDRPVSRIVLGSSYATRGLITTSYYARWLRRALTAEPRSTLFIPHRWESMTSRHQAESCGALVLDVPASAERVVLALPDVGRIDCLPSTPALTLMALGFAGRTVVAPIPETEWAPGTPATFRSLVNLTTTVCQS